MMAYELKHRLEELTLTEGDWSKDDIFIGTDKQWENVKNKDTQFEKGEL